jgi:hypothetical protein
MLFLCNDDIKSKSFKATFQNSRKGGIVQHSVLEIEYSRFRFSSSAQNSLVPQVQNSWCQEASGGQVCRCSPVSSCTTSPKAAEEHGWGIWARVQTSAGHLIFLLGNHFHIMTELAFVTL